jgi:hypothetical protein
MKTRLPRKALSLFLALVMMLSLLPTYALADSTDACGDGCTHEAAIGSTHYDTLDEAAGAAKNGDIIKLLVANTNSSNDIEAIKKLNGKTVTVIGLGKDATTLNIGYPDSTMHITGSSTITFKDMTIVNTNNSDTYERSLSANYNNVHIKGQVTTVYGTSKFENCDFDNNGSTYNVWVYAGNVYLHGCTFNTVNKAPVKLYGEAGNMISAELSGCTFKVQGSKKCDVLVSNLNNNNVPAKDKRNTSLVPLSYDVTMSDCVSTAENYYGVEKTDGFVIGYDEDCPPLEYNIPANITISEKDEQVFCYPAAPATPVAKIGDKEYTSLADAIAAAKEAGSGVIELLPAYNQYPQAWVTECVKEYPEALASAYTFHAFNPNGDEELASKYNSGATLTDEENAYVESALANIQDYLDWPSDFEIHFDEGINEGDVSIMGDYGTFNWLGGFQIPVPAMKAGESMRLLDSVGMKYLYEYMLFNVFQFNCGVVNSNPTANSGKTMSVDLCMYDPDCADVKILIGTTTYTFPTVETPAVVVDKPTEAEKENLVNGASEQHLSDNDKTEVAKQVEALVENVNVAEVVTKLEEAVNLAANQTATETKVKIKLESVKVETTTQTAEKVTLNTAEYDVTPWATITTTVEGQEPMVETRRLTNDEIAQGVTVRLAVPATEAKMAKITHTSSDTEKYPTEEFLAEIKDEAPNQYVEIVLTHFSTVTVKTLDELSEEHVAAIKNADGTFTGYTTLADAIAAVPTNGTETTITMIADVDYGNDIKFGATIAAGQNVILDLNGHTIEATRVAESSTTIIKNNGTLKVVDSGSTKGKLIMHSTVDANPFSVTCNAIYNYGDVTIDGAHIESSEARASYAIDTVKGSMTVNSGEIVGSYCAFRAYSQQGDVSFTINGGEFIGNHAMFVQNSEENHKLTGTINGGEFTGNKTAGYIWTKTGNGALTKITVKDGKFKGGSYNVNGDSNYADTLFCADVGTVVLEGGYYSLNTYYDYTAEGYVALNKLCAAGYACVANTDPATKDAYPWVVAEKAVTYVDNTDTLQQALDNARDGDTIVLAAGSYDTVYLRQNPAKSTARADLNRDASYPAYYREIKNVTIKAADNATVTMNGNIVAESGLFWYSSAPASNQAAMNKENGGFVSYLLLENLTINGLTFNRSGIVLRDNAAVDTRSNICVDGLTIQNCTGTGTATNKDLHFFSAGAGTNDQNFPDTEKKAFNNITIRNNTLDSYYQPICTNNATAVLNGLTVTGNSFTDCMDNQLQLANKVNTGAFVISGNTFTNMTGRVLRLTNAQKTATFDLTNNNIVTPKKYDTGGDGTIAKITGVNGFTVTDTNSQWTAGAFNEGKTTWQAMGDTSLLAQPVAEINDTKYATLAAAIAAVPADGTETTITMIGDETIEGNAGVTIPAGKNIILDLNGYTVSNAVNENKASQVIMNNGTLTIKDSKTGGTITNSVDPDTAVGDWFATPQNNWTTNVVDNNGTLTVESGNLINTAGGNICYAVDNNGADGTTPVFNLKGGLLKSNYAPVRLAPGSTVVTFEMTGATVEGQYGIALNGNSQTAPKYAINIEGGTIKANTYAIYESAFGNVTSVEDITIAISGGCFGNTDAPDTSPLISTSHLSGYITGGYYMADVTALVATGYQCIPTPETDPKHTDYPYTIGEAKTDPVAPTVNKEEVVETSKENVEIPQNLPDGVNAEQAKKAVVDEVLGEITGNTAVTDEGATNIQNDEVDQALAAMIANMRSKSEQLKITVKSVASSATTIEKTSDAITPKFVTTTSATYDVKPYVTITDDQGKTVEHLITNEELAAANVTLSFRLAVPDSMKGDYVNVKHYDGTEGGKDLGLYAVQGEGSGRYVALASNRFSEFELSVSNEQAVVAKNTNTDKVYTTLTAALAEAQSGQTVVLLENISGEMFIVVKADVTLDLAGHDITGASLIAVTGKIKDSATTAETKGTVSADAYVFPSGGIREEDYYLPIYTGDGYQFYRLMISSKWDDNFAGQFDFALRKTDTEAAEAYALLESGLAGSRVMAVITVTWDSASGISGEQSFKYSDELLKDYAEKKGGDMLTATFVGLETLTNVKVQGQFITVNQNGDKLAAICGYLH